MKSTIGAAQNVESMLYLIINEFNLEILQSADSESLMLDGEKDNLKRSIPPLVEQPQQGCFL